LIVAIRRDVPRTPGCRRIDAHRHQDHIKNSFAAFRSRC
jgi:hypothetical protein